MPVAFTICSINYLAQARTLGDSLRQTNPNYEFVIGLVDDLAKAQLPDALVPEYPMIEIDKIGIPDFAGMCERYDITELNTAVKPFFINYFFRTRPDVSSVIYFDPDIIVFQPLERLNQSLETYSLVLTPHTCSPTPDWERPNEQHHLNTGIFNLGFIGLKNDETARAFVNWWEQRLVYECRIDLCAGLFVDQHWVNFAPIYFDNVQIDTYLGYNVAYWNLHERPAIQNPNGQWLVGNPAVPLHFFHYSGYNPFKPDDISKYQTRYTFAQRPDVRPLFDLYSQHLLQNHNEIYRTYACAYIKPPVVKRYQRVRKMLKKPFNALISALEQPAPTR